MRKTADPATNRRGSVLILVVSLLILLALLGTAFVTTSSIDRTSSVQAVSNGQVNMLVDGASNLVEQLILDDVSGKQTSGTPPANPPIYYRPRSDVTTGGTVYSYYNFDAIKDAGNPYPNCTFLASRVPEKPGSVWLWPAITAPPTQNSNSSQFGSPVLGQAPYAIRQSMQPSYVQIAGKWYPAFKYTDASNNPQTVLAADTDGDGVADAGLWPVGTWGGTTFYVALRIIDNNSAIDASVAWKWNDESTTGTFQYNNFFPTNVNLLSLLTPSSQMTTLNQYRFNQTGTPSASLTAVSDTPAVRSDFTFVNPYDAMWMQLGRRISNPGYNTTAIKYQALSSVDTAALAYKFVLKTSQGNSNVETALNTALYGASVPATPYSPDNTLNQTAADNLVQASGTGWGDANFGSSATFNLKPYLVAFNGNSNQVPPASTVDPSNLTLPAPIAGAAMAPYSSNGISKTSVNTASFNELWRAFWSVMAGSATASQTPFGAVADSSQHMFRSPLRDSSGSASPRLMDNYKVLLLRSALAAANAVNLRSNNTNVTSTDLTIDGGGTCGPVQVRVFGYQPQPFITEVYANTDNVTKFNGVKANPKGYVAVELFNPYTTAISLTNYHLAVLDRRPTAGGGAYPNMNLTSIGPSFSGITVPAGGRIIIENYSASPPGGDVNAANGRPTAAQTAIAASGVTSYYVQDLYKVMQDPADPTVPGGELEIFRPRHADGTLDTTTPGYTETNVYDMVPVDQFDFTGFALSSGGTFNQGHYVKLNDAPNTAGAWKFVYPGRYTGSAASARVEGFQVASFPSGSSAPAPTVAIALGSASEQLSYVNGFLPIQLGSKDWGGPNAPLASTGNKFPFGGFARNGDMMQIPFMGRYVIRQVNNPGGILVNAPNVFMEINAITTDASLCDDLDPSDDGRENIGRFCPVPPDPAATINPASPSQDGTKADDLTGGTPQWRYHWAESLFDYLTVLNPNDDYLPNAVPLPNTSSPIEYFNNATDAMTPVANAPNFNAVGPNNNTENTIGVEGLINVNTAPWRVLNALPMIPQNAALNQSLAQAIVQYREKYGPYKSICELQNVRDKYLSGTSNSFSNAWGSFPAGDPDDADGDISPAGVGSTDGVRGDFEEQYLVLNRISNLITTRSDVFTCYVQVQGWKAAGTANPQLVVQRRVAFIVDRTGITATNRSLKTTPVPTD